MHELARGLWHWEAPHPGWKESEPWAKEVSSYAIVDAERLVLFDPLAPPSEIDELAATRETVIVLTAPWHERDTRSLVERLGVPVVTPKPDTQEDLMQKFGVTAEQAEGGSSDLKWLVEGDAREVHFYAVGEQVPLGFEVFPGRDTNDRVLWIESHRAVLSGDTLVDFGRGLEIHDEWLWAGVTRGQVVEGLRPLLERPIERVLPTHGEPTDRAALERALA